MKNYRNKFFKSLKNKIKDDERNIECVSQLKEEIKSLKEKNQSLKSDNEFLKKKDQMLKHDIETILYHVNVDKKLLEYVIYKYKMSVEQETLIINLSNGKLKIKNNHTSFEEMSSLSFKEVGCSLQRTLNI